MNTTRKVSKMQAYNGMPWTPNPVCDNPFFLLALVCMTQTKHWTQTTITRVVVAAAGVAALGWLLKGIDPQRLVQAFEAVPLWVWPVSVVGMVVSHLLRGGRMRAEWRERLDMGWLTAWALVVRHSAWVVLAPMRGGEGVYLWALHRQGDIPLRDAGMSLLKLRLQDMAVLGVMAVLALTPASWPVRVLAALVALSAAMWVLPMAWRAIVARARASIPTQNMVPSKPMPAATWESWFYALSNWVVKLAAIALPLWALAGSRVADGAVAGLDAAWRGALGGELAAAMPFQPPAGLGPYEAGVWAGVRSAADLPLAEVAAAALTVHLLMLLVTVASATLARLMGWSARSYRKPSPPAANDPYWDSAP